MPGSSAGTWKSAVRRPPDAAGAAGAATSASAAQAGALTTTLDIVQVLPGPGLDGRDLAVRGLEAQPEIAIRRAIGDCMALRIVLVRLHVEALAVELAQFRL